MDIIRKVHRTQGPGHVLAFFTGQDEIERAGRLLSEAVAQENADRHAMGIEAGGEEVDTGVSELVVVPLFGALSAEAQASAFRPAKAGVRKVRLSAAAQFIERLHCVYVGERGGSKRGSCGVDWRYDCCGKRESSHEYVFAGMICAGFPWPMENMVAAETCGSKVPGADPQRIGIALQRSCGGVFRSRREPLRVDLISRHVLAPGFQPEKPEPGMNGHACYINALILMAIYGRPYISLCPLLPPYLLSRWSWRPT